jgi:hypothetical protein
MPSNVRAFNSPGQCGRPQPDDPEFAVVVGDCPLWPGCGCEVDLPWPHGRNEPVEMEERCDDL